MVVELPRTGKVRSDKRTFDVSVIEHHVRQRSHDTPLDRDTANGERCRLVEVIDDVLLGRIRDEDPHVVEVYGGPSDIDDDR